MLTGKARILDSKLPHTSMQGIDVGSGSALNARHITAR
jgi:hypothetical protein